MGKLGLVTGLVCCSFLLVACSQDAEPQSSDESVASTESVDSLESNQSETESEQLAGVFVGEVNGGIVEVAVPFENERTEEITTYAQEVGFEGELFFALQTVSNQANNVMVGCSPRLVTSNGETVEFENAFIFVGNLQDLVPEGDVEMYNQGVTLYNSLLGTDVLPGATASSVFVAAGEVAANGSIFSGAYTMETLLQGCDTKLVSK